MAGKTGKVWSLSRFWVSICSYQQQPVKKIFGVEYWTLPGSNSPWRTLGSFGNFGLEIQTWESTSALMSKSDNQLVEI